MDGGNGCSEKSGVSAFAHLEKPVRLALTMGDPAGIGPEIVSRVVASSDERVRTIVVGEAAHLRQGARAAGVSIRIVDCVEEDFSHASDEVFRNTTRDSVCVVEPAETESIGEVRPGCLDARCGRAAWLAIRSAVRLIERGAADALVTAPLNKEALNLAGCPYPGHTELLAALAGVDSVGMLLVGGGLRVALATIHEALSEVPGHITRERILGLLEMMDSFIPWFGLEGDGDSSRTVRRKARLAVAALNPHAGEAGMFGFEEAETIGPAVARAAARGIDVVGPLSADTIFHRHRRGEFDAVLAMYHDQALIPVKTLDFEHGVNVTMGLPFVRTSVDHGTAFDLAGRGVADPSSLAAAISTAILLEGNRRRILKTES